MLYIIAGTLFVLSRLATAVLALGGLAAVIISLPQDDYFIFEQGLLAFALALLFALLARLLRRFEL